jgi:DNA repair protein RecN (Recombination protein N)
MLTEVNIRHFVLVENLTLDFRQGFHVITGETGAGKSILFDAMHLGLGARLSSHLTPQGKQPTIISLSFDLRQLPLAQQWLEAHGFPYEDESGDCTIRRQITPEGKSRAYINDMPCQLGKLKELAPQLVQVHGQHQHQQLSQSKIQLHSLDQFAGNQGLLDKVQSLFCRYQSLNREHEQLSAQCVRQSSDLDLFSYQLDELVNANIEKDEWEKLHQEHQRLHQSKQVMHSLEQALTCTSQAEPNHAIQLVEQALHHLRQIPFEDPELGNILQLLESALIHLQEADGELQQYFTQLDLSPEKLGQIETRLSLLHDLARKHHVAPEELKSVEISLSEKIDQLQHLDSRLAAVKEKQQTLQSEYQGLAQKLSAQRKKASKAFGQCISDYLKQMNMPDAHFSIQLDNKAQGVYINGLDSCQFLFSANAGQKAAPLEQIASGGELSRVSLAIFTALSQRANSIIPPCTLLFDEVDTGISGKTADTVGRLLKTIASHTQAICISHLPQVAAKADHHFLVSKASDGKRTTTKMQTLEGGARIQEIARLLAGEEISEQAIANAKAMTEKV